MFDVISNARIHKTNINQYIRVDELNIKLKDYHILINDQTDGHSFKKVDTSKFLYENEDGFKINDILDRLFGDKIQVILSDGHDSLSGSSEVVNIKPVKYGEINCTRIDSPTIDDIVDNIPFYRDVLIIDLSSHSEFVYKNKYTVMGVISNLNEFIYINKSKPISVIYKKDKTLYYFNQ